MYNKILCYLCIFSPKYVELLSFFLQPNFAYVSSTKLSAPLLLNLSLPNPLSSEMGGAATSITAGALSHFSPKSHAGRILLLELQLQYLSYTHHSCLRLLSFKHKHTQTKETAI